MDKNLGCFFGSGEINQILSSYKGLGGFVGTSPEAMCRQRERLLDPLEVRKGCDLRRPEVEK